MQGLEFRRDVFQGYLLGVDETPAIRLDANMLAYVPRSSLPLVKLLGIQGAKGVFRT